MMRRLPADDSRIELPHWSELRSVRGLLSVVLSSGATMVTKVLTGYWAARRSGVDQPGRLRAGMALVARGEFSRARQ
jgi:Kef-type K+ transport system membrane component KefB